MYIDIILILYPIILFYYFILYYIILILSNFACFLPLLWEYSWKFKKKAFLNVMPHSVDPNLT